MDKVTEVFLNWQVLLISFAAFAVLGVVRAMGTRKNAKGEVLGGWAQTSYFQIGLPVYPYIITMGLVFLPGVPMPEVVSSTLAVKVLYGVYSGWLSGFSFQIVKNVLKKTGLSENLQG